MQGLVQTIHGPASPRKRQPAYHTTGAPAHKAEVLYWRQGANLTLGQQESAAAYGQERIRSLLVGFSSWESLRHYAALRCAVSRWMCIASSSSANGLTR